MNDAGYGFVDDTRVVLARSVEDDSWEVWIRAPNGVLVVALHCQFGIAFAGVDDDPEGLHVLLGE